MTLEEVAAVVGGAVADAPADLLVTGPAFVDSRRPVPKGLFGAFAGEHVDGHDHARAAVAAGAAAVLATRPVGAPAVVVPDVRDALAALAQHVLGRLPEVRVLAVTGSQGKTSTKDLLAAVLADSAPTVATHGSFNNELGLPLTVLRADEATRFLLLEMGARGEGHIRALCRIARPQVSVVLNVGKAHLGEFGTREGIAQAKGELVEALDRDGVAVLNADDAMVRAMAGRTTAGVLTFGTAPEADVRVSDLELDAAGLPRFAVTHPGGRTSVGLRLVGAHQAMNAAAALAAALAVGVPVDRAAAVLGGVSTLSPWRMEVHRRADGLTVVNDAYNANPDSVAAALQALVALGRGRGPGTRTVAVLGEMLELGASADAEHDAVGRLAVRLGVGRVVAVGAGARGIHRGASTEQPGPSAVQGEDPVFVSDNDEAMTWLGTHLRAGDVVLVKASRGAHLDRVADALLAADAGGHGPEVSG